MDWKKELLETLKYESKEVLNLDKEFAWISPSKELVCFYETKKTPNMGLVRDQIAALYFLDIFLLQYSRWSLKLRRQFTDMVHEISPWIVIILR
jgi:hypothetical protein